MRQIGPLDISTVGEDKGEVVIDAYFVGVVTQDFGEGFVDPKLRGDENATLGRGEPVGAIILEPRENSMEVAVEELGGANEWSLGNDAIGIMTGRGVWKN